MLRAGTLLAWPTLLKEASRKRISLTRTSTRFSLHDCHIHGIELRTGDPIDDDWTHDLCLDIDFIVDGWRGLDGQWTFLVAPA